MMFKQRYVWFPMLLLAGALSAQSVRIGELKAAVDRALGAPQAYTCSAITQPTFPHGCNTMIGLVYKRTIEKRHYEVILFYVPDTQTSRLHPPLRLAEIRFEADRPEAANLLANNFRELVSMCAQQCELFLEQGVPHNLVIQQKAKSGPQTEASVLRIDGYEPAAVDSMDDMATSIWISESFGSGQDRVDLHLEWKPQKPN